MALRQTTEEFIAKARAVWGEEYDYSQTVYCGPLRPVRIICRVHGVFEQLPYNHLDGHRCCRCAREATRLPAAEFIRRARALFPNYDYSRVNYQGANVKVTVVCRQHGAFERRPGEILSYQRGCPVCCRKPRARRGPQIKWRREEVAAIREVFLERRRMGILFERWPGAARPK